MRLQHLHKLRLMFERIGNRFPRPHAPHLHDRIRPILLELHAPHRPPAAQLLDAPYIASDIRLHPRGDGSAILRLRCGHVVDWRSVPFRHSSSPSVRFFSSPATMSYKDAFRGWTRLTSPSHRQDGSEIGRAHV